MYKQYIYHYIFLYLGHTRICLPFDLSNLLLPMKFTKKKKIGYGCLPILEKTFTRIASNIRIICNLELSPIDLKNSPLSTIDFVFIILC